MNQTVLDLLDGPIGFGFRVAAVVVLIHVGIWVFTGVRLLGDDDSYDDGYSDGRRGRGRGRRSGVLSRIIFGALCAVILLPVANDPVVAVETAYDWITGLGDRFTGDTTTTTMPPAPGE